jgi:polysaccharide export outer membrane protein
MTAKVGRVSAASSLIALHLAWSVLLLSCGLGLGAWAATTDSAYRLDTGDRIRIWVYGEDDLTVETRLGDSGVISYPFLGDIKVAGLTVSRLEDLVTERLKGPYLVDPRVTVDIVEYRDFYVNGEVEDPGGYPFEPGLTVRKAISIAGGFKERAAKDKVYIIHEDQDESARRRVSLDSRVRPGDIITVQQSFF